MGSGICGGHCGDCCCGQSHAAEAEKFATCRVEGVHRDAMLAEVLCQLKVFLYVKRLEIIRYVNASKIIVAGGAKAITDPRLGDDVGGLVGELDLFAELADADTQIFGLVGVGSPHGMEQRAMGKDLSGVLG